MAYLALDTISDRHGHTARHDVVPDDHLHVQVHPGSFVHLADDDPRAQKPGPAAQYGRHDNVEEATAKPGRKRNR